MRKLYLLFILLFTCLAGYGQSDQSYSENDLQTRTGYFLVENTPVQMNLPENLVFIDTESAKNISIHPIAFPMRMSLVSLSLRMSFRAMEVICFV